MVLLKVVWIEAFLLIKVLHFLDVMCVGAAVVKWKLLSKGTGLSLRYLET